VMLLTETAAKNNILQWVCNNAGCSQTEISDSRAPGQVIPQAKSYIGRYIHKLIWQSPRGRSNKLL
jgi:hypothetical protein